MKEAYSFEDVFTDKHLSITCISTPIDWQNHKLVRYGFEIGVEGDLDYRVSTPEEPFPVLSLDEMNAFLMLLKGVAFLMHRQYCPEGHEIEQIVNEVKE